MPPPRSNSLHPRAGQSPPASVSTPALGGAGRLCGAGWQPIPAHAPLRSSAPSSRRFSHAVRAKGARERRSGSAGAPPVVRTEFKGSPRCISFPRTQTFSRVGTFILVDGPAPVRPFPDLRNRRRHEPFPEWNWAPRRRARATGFRRHDRANGCLGPLHSGAHCPSPTQFTTQHRWARRLGGKPVVVPQLRASTFAANHATSERRPPPTCGAFRDSVRLDPRVYTLRTV